MENDDELEKIGDSILDQLQQSLTTKSQPNSVSNEPLTTENLEKFVLDKTAVLVAQSMEAVENLKDYIQAGASDKEITAFAEVVKASTSAIETLNKLLQSKDKIENSIKLKEMDIKARKELNVVDNSVKLLLSREDLMKQLIKDSDKIIDVTPTITD
jgi:6-pyruvoyl-tetrahydropterin synthase